MSILRRIRKAIREGRYDFADHAREEAEADGLWLEEVVEILRTGQLASTYTDDPRGPRYGVRGDLETVTIEVVCRFEFDGSLRVIITVYVMD